jgi:hypothetical protein
MSHAVRLSHVYTHHFECRSQSGDPRPVGMKIPSPDICSTSEANNMAAYLRSERNQRQSAGLWRRTGGNMTTALNRADTSGKDCITIQAVSGYCSVLSPDQTPGKPPGSTEPPVVPPGPGKPPVQPPGPDNPPVKPHAPGKPPVSEEKAVFAYAGPSAPISQAHSHRRRPQKKYKNACFSDLSLIPVGYYALDRNSCPVWYSLSGLCT